MTLKRLWAASVIVALCIMLWPAPVDAQRRAVVRVYRTPVVRVQRGPVVWGGYHWGSPYVYGAWGYPFGWYGSYPYPYPYYGQGYPYDGASLRIQVTPKTAEVFIDGYFAGMVDEFDGTFQRLRVEPGEHEVAIYADGFRTLARRLYLQPLGSVTIKEALEPVQPGDVQEPRPTAQRSASATPSDPRRPVPPRPSAPAQDRQAPPPASSSDDGSYGTLSMLVQPGGADVLIDGERWEGPGVNERLLIQLAPGSHRIEVRRSGYQTFSRTVDVRAGQTETVNVSLSRQ